MNKRRSSTARSVLAALALACVVYGSAPAAASAHAYLEAATPAAGARAPSVPAVVAMRFDEPLNRALSSAAIYDARTEKRIAAQTSIPRPLEMMLRPAAPLPRGAYRVEWHSVSGADGHEVEGSFSFGVQAAVIGGASTTQSPLSGLGWLRALVRAAMYAALFVFAGALMLRALLGARAGALWVVPAAVRSILGDEAPVIERRERVLLVDTGGLAVTFAAASALIDTQLAAGHLSAQSVHAFLLSNTTGLARVGLVAFLALAVAGVVGAPRLAALAAALALGCLALSGHAHSVSPRKLGVAIDWVHLLAGAIWLGGIAIVVLVWLPRLRRSEPDLRRAVMRDLLPRFGRVALPAFAVVAFTGSLNAYIQVRHPAQLVDSSYGRALLFKTAFVCLIAAFSFVHALRLRPRLLAANPHPDARLERRHWRLLRAEPLIGVALAASVALLVSFPTPAQIAAARALPTPPLAACDPCILPLPAADQLSVATDAGSSVVAAWMGHRDGHLEGQIRVLDLYGQPSGTPFEIQGAGAVSPSCGPACRTFVIRGTPPLLTVILDPDRQPRVATLSTDWRPGGSAVARRILESAQAAMRRLRGVVVDEQVNSVPGLYAASVNRLNAPDRSSTSSYVVAPPAPRRLETQLLEIGGRQWFRAPGAGWQLTNTKGLLPFSTNTWFTWTRNAEAIRLISIDRGHHRALATIALLDPGVPLWQTLQIDLATQRVLWARLINSGHFITDRYSNFNRVPLIRPPTGPGA